MGKKNDSEIREQQIVMSQNVAYVDFTNEDYIKAKQCLVFFSPFLVLCPTPCGKLTQFSRIPYC
jgi:hypothetical protein